MYLIYFENKNDFRYYVNHVVYDSNGEVNHIYFSSRIRGDYHETFYKNYDESEVDKISTYIINGLINRTHFIGLENDGYTFIVKKL